MNDENIHDKMIKIFGKIPDFSILEEKIDLDLQLEYFECSKNVKTALDPEEVLKSKDDIFNLDLDENLRKNRFAELASIEEVEPYRTIEKYVKSECDELRYWAVLALQESRMLLESNLLDENKVFISTGLGGKGGKLRYFIVLLNNKKSCFTRTEKKVVQNEFDFMVKQHSGEIEKLLFVQQYATITALLPLHASIKSLFKETIRECNQYGEFLKENFIVTNVKELDKHEIDEFVNTKSNLNQEKPD